MPTHRSYVSCCFGLLFALTSASLAQPVDTDWSGVIVEAVGDELAARFPAQAMGVEVRLSRSGGLPDALQPIRISFAETLTVPKGHTKVDVLAGDAVQGGSKIGWAMLYVAHYDSVAVPLQSVGRDEPVPTSALAFAWMETTRFSGEPLRAADVRTLQAGGPLFAHRPLREGRALRKSDVRPAYAIETGGAVALKYERSGILLRLACKAREPGYVGDIIRVYFPQTDVMYRARLTAPGKAEWVETM